MLAVLQRSLSAGCRRAGDYYGDIMNKEVNFKEDLQWKGTFGVSKWFSRQERF